MSEEMEHHRGVDLLKAKLRRTRGQALTGEDE
jgi:hypothetical protein